jgi:hypothetical protein
MLFAHSFAGRVRSFAHEHDDIPAFHAAYLVGTFLAAAIFNLGFFLALIVMHMCLDFVKYRDYHRYGYAETIWAMFVENVIDIMLFFVALTFSVYTSHSFALAALSGFARTELTIVRAIGTIVPKFEILQHLATILLDIHAYMHTPHVLPHHELTDGQTWAVFITVSCISLLGIAFLLFHGRTDELMWILQNELSLKL